MTDLVFIEMNLQVFWKISFSTNAFRTRKEISWKKEDINIPFGLHDHIARS